MSVSMKNFEVPSGKKLEIQTVSSNYHIQLSPGLVPFNQAMLGFLFVHHILIFFGKAIMYIIPGLPGRRVVCDAMNQESGTRSTLLQFLGGDAVTLGHTAEAFPLCSHCSERDAVHVQVVTCFPLESQIHQTLQIGKTICNCIDEIHHSLIWLPFLFNAPLRSDLNAHSHFQTVK